VAAREHDYAAAHRGRRGRWRGAVQPEARNSGAGAPEPLTQLAAENRPASRNGTLRTGACLNPHQNMSWSPYDDAR